MLERLWSSQAAVLRHVANEQGWHILTLRHEQQLCGGLAHLTDAARGRLKLQGEDRLNGIDDDQRRFDAGDLFENSFETRFSEQIERRLSDGEALAARFHLMLRLFAGAVQHRADGSCQIGRSLQQQRGLPDARLATEEHERSRNNPAAQDAIELVDPRRDPRVLFDLNVGVQLRRARAARRRVAMTNGGGAGHFGGTLFDQRVPRATIRAASQPLRRLRTTLLTHEHGGRSLRH